ncbi:hypothetical protein [Streptomyces paludis]|nr:hypothetical protein [Streptomyces paludis]
MSTSDQDAAVDTPIPDLEGPAPERPADRSADPAVGLVTDPAMDPADPEYDGLTPRQARLLGVAVASVFLTGLAALLVVRLAERTSVLVVGVYGIAMIMCGVVIELSRHGRTRLGTWLLGLTLVAALGADWLLLP